MSQKNEDRLDDAVEMEPLEPHPLAQIQGLLPHLHNSTGKSQHFPVFIILISGIQIGIFYTFDFVELMLFFGNDPHRRHEIWRLVTSSFILAPSSCNSEELWFNIGIQLTAGILLEKVYGWKRVVLIYYGSVVGGSTLFITCKFSYGYGAWGGVSGIIAAHFVIIILNWKEMENKVIRLMGMALLTGSNTAIGMFDNKLRSIGVGMTHIGGAITGFFISIIILKNFEPESKWKKRQHLCGWLLTLIAIVAIIINVAFPSHFLRPEWNFNYREICVAYNLNHKLNFHAEELRWCEMEEDCTQQRDQFIFHGVIPENDKYFVCSFEHAHY